MPAVELAAQAVAAIHPVTGEPYCASCTPRNFGSPDLDNLARVTIDVAAPEVCACPKCGYAYQTPPSIAIGALSAEVARLRGIVEKLVATHDAGRLPADRIGRKDGA